MELSNALVVGMFAVVLCVVGVVLLAGLFLMMGFLWRRAQAQRVAPLNDPALVAPTDSHMEAGQAALEALDWSALARDDATLVMEGTHILDNWHFRGQLCCAETPWLVYDLRSQLEHAVLRARTRSDILRFEIDCRKNQPVVTVTLNNEDAGRIVYQSDVIALHAPDETLLATVARVKNVVFAGSRTTGVVPGTVRCGERELGGLNGFLPNVPPRYSHPTLHGSLLQGLPSTLDAHEKRCLLILISFDIFRRIDDILYYKRNMSRNAGVHVKV